MRGLFIVAFVVVIGASPLAALAQEATVEAPPCEALTLNDQYWSAVCRPEPEEGLLIPAPPEESQVMQPYMVVFTEEFAATRPLADAEFMVVYVKAGVFVLDRGSSMPGSVVVSSTYDEIPILERIDDEPYYQDPATGPDHLRNADDTACSRACAVPMDKPIRLRAGDVAVAQAGTLCLWCLLGTNKEKDGETGMLEVYALRDVNRSAESFSWITDWEATKAAGLSATPAAMGWAYNPPGTRCGGG